MLDLNGTIRNKVTALLVGVSAIQTEDASCHTPLARPTDLDMSQGGSTGAYFSFATAPSGTSTYPVLL
jgi:hypothetical protein